jgi:hypothetical protein
MKIKNYRSRRSLRKNNKSRRLKQGGSPTHEADDNLNKAYRNIYNFSGDTSHWLSEYLKVGVKHNDDYKKIEKINDMLLTGHRMMKEGYDKFEELYTNP